MTLNTFLRFRENMSQSLRSAINAVDNLRRRADQTTQRLRVLARLRIQPLINLRDRASQRIRLLGANLRRLGRSSVAPLVRLRDLASFQLNVIKFELRRLGSRVAAATVRIRDFASFQISVIWFELRRIGSYIATATVRLRDLAIRGITAVWNGLRLVGSYVATATVRLRNLASAALARIGAGLRAYGSRVWTATVNMKDKVTPALRVIEARAQQATQAIMGLGAALGLTAGGSLAQATGAGHSDALVAAQTRLTRDQVTGLVDQNYYSGNGASREGVNEIVQRIAQQSKLEGKDLEEAVRVASQLSTLNPEASINELVRPLTAQLNAQKVSFERTADALVYLQKQSGDQYDDAFDTFTEYATTASKNGISPERLASGLVAAQKVGGWNYDTGADALREWGIRTITSIDKNAVDALTTVLGKARTKQLYTELKNGEIDAFGFLSEVVQGLNKIDNPIKKNLAQVALYGTMFEDNDKAISAFFNGLMDTADTTGALTASYNELKRSDPTTPLTQAWLKVKETTKGVGEEILTSLTPALQSFTKWASSKEGQQAISDFSARLGDLAEIAGGKLADAFKWTIENWDKVESVIKKVAIALAALAVMGPTIKAIGDAVTVLKGLNSVGKWLATIAGFGESTGLLALAGRMGLVGLAVLGVVAAVTALVEIWKNWDDYSADWSGEAIAHWFDSIGAAIDGVVAKVGNLITKFKELQEAKVNDDGTVTPGKSAIGALGSVAADANSSASNTITQGIDSFFPGYADVSNWISDKVPGLAVGAREIPYDNMPARLHKGEMVVPAEEAQMIREMSANRGPARMSGGSGAATGEGDINIYHYGDINNGMDEKAFYANVARQLREESQISTEGGSN